MLGGISPERGECYREGVLALERGLAIFRGDRAVFFCGKQIGLIKAPTPAPATFSIVGIETEITFP